MHVVERTTITASSDPWKALIEKGPDSVSVKLIDTTPGRREDGLRPLAQFTMDLVGLQKLSGFLAELEGFLA